VRATIAARGWEPSADATSSAANFLDALHRLVDRAPSANRALSTLAQRDEARGAYYENLA